jgi:hypothetical protein
VSFKKQGLLALREDLASSAGFGGVRVKRIKENKTLQNCTFLMKVKKLIQNAK